MRDIDEHPVFHQQIAIAPPPVADPHEQSLALGRLAQKWLDLHGVQRGPAAGADVIPIGKAGEMAGLASGNGSADPFGECLFKRYLKPGEFLDPGKASKRARPVPEHIRVPIGPPGFVGGGQPLQHRGDHGHAFGTLVGIALMPLHSVLGQWTGQISGKAPVPPRAVIDRPLACGDHQFGNVEEHIAFHRTPVLHPVKFAKSQLRKRAHGINAQPGLAEMAGVIPGRCDPGTVFETAAKGDVITAMKMRKRRQKRRHEPPGILCRTGQGIEGMHHVYRGTRGKKRLCRGGKPIAAHIAMGRDIGTERGLVVEGGHRPLSLSRRPRSNRRRSGAGRTSQG